MPINIELLLAPISAGSPTGADIRTDSSATSVYYQLKDFRNEARLIERKNMRGDEYQDSLPVWRKVETLASDILSGKTKDLEVAAWTIEALVRIDGFAGLVQGLSLVNQLVDCYWDDLYPQSDEDPIESKVASIAGLNGLDIDGTLIVPLKQINLTDADCENYQFWQFEQSLELAKIHDAKAKAAKIEAGVIPLDTIKLAARKTSPSFYSNLKASIHDALTMLGELTVKLDDKCGEFSPPTSKIKASLERANEFLTYLLSDTVKTPANQSAPAESNSNELPVREHQTSHLAVNQRADALLSIENAAQYFTQAEPHSPISYVLNRMIRWANMPYPALMKEIITNKEELTNLFDLAGIDEDK